MQGIVNSLLNFLFTLALCLFAKGALAGEAVFLPGFFDPARRLALPDLSNIKIIRFLTADDYPPFHFLTPEGTLTGFDVEIARAICDELKVPCTIQARRFETLAEALATRQGDALMAGLGRTADNRTAMAFSVPYYRTPARFVRRLPTNSMIDATPEGLRAKSIGVESGSAHEAYLRAFFPTSVLRPYEDRDGLRAALKRGEIDALFGDGISLSFWLNGASAAQCCAFFGGPFTESAFFGEGVGVSLRRQDVPLKLAIDYALNKIAEKGVYADLYLKYFPIGFY